jgi:acetyl esterase
VSFYCDSENRVTPHYVSPNTQPKLRISERKEIPMPLHPQVKKVLDAMTAAGPPLHHLTPQEARKAVLAMRATTGEPERVGKVEDRMFHGPGGQLPVRIYTPDGRGPFPVLVYFHGGGWVVGAIDTVDASCRSLANLVGCIVVSADYRLAPEHKFPAAAEDAYAALQWTALQLFMVIPHAWR